MQTIADKFSTDKFHIKVLFLPVAYAEMNQVEVVWFDVKRHVAKSNFQFKLDIPEEVAVNSMKEFRLILFDKFCTHGNKEEERYLAMAEGHDTNALTSAVGKIDNVINASPNNITKDNEDTVTESG